MLTRRQRRMVRAWMLAPLAALMLCAAAAPALAASDAELHAMELKRKEQEAARIKAERVKLELAQREAAQWDAQMSAPMRSGAADQVEPTSEQAQLAAAIERILPQLDHTEFTVRERATHQLIALGPAAAQPLRDVLRHSRQSVEAASRIARVIGVVRDDAQAVNGLKIALDGPSQVVHRGESVTFKVSLANVTRNPLRIMVGSSFSGVAFSTGAALRVLPSSAAGEGGEQELVYPRWLLMSCGTGDQPTIITIEPHDAIVYECTLRFEPAPAHGLSPQDRKRTPLALQTQQLMFPLAAGRHCFVVVHEQQGDEPAPMQLGAPAPPPGAAGGPMQPVPLRAEVTEGQEASAGSYWNGEARSNVVTVSFDAQPAPTPQPSEQTRPGGAE